jgi:1-acyl-sn-glycerol-3-phosphate acyltransferase
MLNLKKIKKIYKVFSITWKYLKLSSFSLSNVDDLKRRWSEEIISLFNIQLEILNRPKGNEGPFLFIGNHISYLDIPVLVNATPEISFVSKNEVKSWPIIGKAAIKGGTVFVKRENNLSRSNAKIQIGKKLVEENKKIIIFPSGTTSIRTSHFWKKGAFEIAKNNNVKIYPFRINYKQLGAAAYVGEDNFLIHMYQLLNCKEIKVMIEFHNPVYVTDVAHDCIVWKKWCEH